jgi:hypothetical protein
MLDTRNDTLTYLPNAMDTPNAEALCGMARTNKLHLLLVLIEAIIGSLRLRTSPARPEIRSHRNSQAVKRLWSLNAWLDAKSIYLIASFDIGFLLSFPQICHDLRI